MAYPGYAQWQQADTRHANSLDELRAAVESLERSRSKIAGQYADVLMLAEAVARFEATFAKP